MKNWLKAIFGSLVATSIIVSNNNVIAYTATITQKVFTTDEIINSTEKTINGGTLYFSEPANTYDFIDEHGQYNSVYMNDEHIYWSRFNTNMEIENTVVIDMFYDKSNTSDFDKELVSNFGNAIYYNEHLYIVYGREDISTVAPEGARYNTMAVVKYDKQGNIIAELEMKASHLSNSTAWSQGTYLPFYPNSNCSLAVNDEGILACLYGKTQFESHQMSNIFFLDISGEGIEWVSNRYTASEENKIRYEDVISYNNSHSMFTRIIPTRDGSFVFADSGDASKRGLTIGKIFENELKQMKLKQYIAIHYREGGNFTWGYNYTYSVPGNIVEVSDGYFYIGAMEKTLSMNYSKSINEPWNLLVQKYKTNFQNATEREEATVFDTPIRVPTGEKPELDKGRLYLQGTEVDYGIKWLTDLNNKIIIQVRTAKIDDNHVAILWEELPYSYDAVIDANARDEDQGNIYYMIIDNNGEIVFEKTPIPNVRLPKTEDLVYKDGKICWTTALGNRNEITVNILDIEHPISTCIGDITKDGKVDSDDAAMVMDKYKMDEWTTEDLNIADMNKDGKLNADDAAAIMDIFNKQ